MAAEINDQFVDVDFTQDPNYTFGDLGGTLYTGFADYETAEELMTDAQIDEFIELLEATPEAGIDFLIRWVYNQLREGSCVGNAGTQGTEVIGVKQHGDRFPRLSAISLYKQIGRSASSGAVVSDAMEALKGVGVLPLDNAENRARYGDHVMPATGFSKPFPEFWKETAAAFRGVEFLVLRSVQAIFSALCKGHPVIVGREGHSILYVRPMRKNGRRVVKYVNSWGEWGDAGGNLPSGFGYDTESQIKKSASWAFAIRAIKPLEPAA